MLASATETAISRPTAILFAKMRWFTFSRVMASPHRIVDELLNWTITVASACFMVNEKL